MNARVPYQISPPQVLRPLNKAVPFVGSRTHKILVDMGPSDEARIRARSQFLMPMPCNHPMKAFWTGSYTDKGKKELVICPSTSGDFLNVAYAERKGFHIGANAPLVDINGRTFLKDPIPIPCGHCIGCRMMSAREWKVRMCLESLEYPDNTYFVTLTYDDRHLPIDENGQPFLNKSHIQGFMKYLRGYGAQRKFRYFCCGEYGENTARPHYHLILYGDLGDLLPYEFGSYHSGLVYECWPFGLHDVKKADSGTIAYVAGYVEKKQKDPLYNTYPVKPFRMMSRKPALGSNVLDKIGFPDVQVYGNFGNVHNTSCPKGLLKKLEDKDWYPDFKRMMEDKAKLSLGNTTYVYGTGDQDLAGFAADRKCELELEKVRNETL